MKRNLLVTAASFAALAVGLPAYGQPRPGLSELPIRQMVMFSSGVAYYQREGQVDGNARVDLQFHMDNINDLLKSMVVEDGSHQQIATVTYDNRNPIDQTLKSFAVDLTKNPSIGDLLNQVRGEQVEVLTTVDPRAAVGQTETITGLVVGVEKQRQPLGKDQFVDVSQVNLLTKEGLRGVPLSQVQRVRFLKQGLDQEFRKALEVLATGHDKQKKTVSLNFTGTDKRTVKVGYVTESPIWKTSYRLSLQRSKKEKKQDVKPRASEQPHIAKEENGDTVILQGWAIVENTTDEDWNSVQLGLVSGRPISFQMDLYQPLFITRPVEELELFASLRPPTYDGNMMLDEVAASNGGPGFGGRGEKRDAKGEGKGKGAAQWGAVPKPQMAREMLKKMNDADAVHFRKDVATAAVSTELGEYFQYLIKQPVSLPRQKSALLPIVNEEVKGTRVSIYNEGVHKKFPLLGLKFTNSTSLHLCQGPITLFEDSTYAGDAKIADLQPKETRLLSYAIDLGTEVDAQQKDTEELLKVKIVKGLVHQQFLRKEIKTYKIKNRSEHTRTVMIEHPYRPAFKLVAPEKPTERARNVYRFEVVCATNKPVDYVVEEHLPRQEVVSISNTNDEFVRVLIRSSATSSKVKEALERAVQMRAKVSECQQEIAREERLLKTIEQDQARMRANMAQVPQTSEAYKRYVKKFDDQETQIEALRDKIAKLNDKRDGTQREFDSYLTALNVE
jgi:hypothetical protein